jgi:hypothetical protein
MKEKIRSHYHHFLPPKQKKHASMQSGSATRSRVHFDIPHTHTHNKRKAEQQYEHASDAKSKAQTQPRPNVLRVLNPEKKQKRRLVSLGAAAQKRR